MFHVMLYVGLILMSFFLLLSIFFFVQNHVAKLIGDVTGWNTRKGRKQFYKKREEIATVILTYNRAGDLNGFNRENEISEIFEVEEEIMEVHTDESIERG